jgi:biopolymer transport protein ExbD
MAFNVDRSPARIVDMNITPLVDVMLVLLIIFMVTMPLRTYGIGVDLTQRAPRTPQPIAQPIALRIDPAGRLTWNGSPLPMSALEATMKVEVARYPQPRDQPLLQIDADQDSRYDTLATVLATARNSGLIRVGFVEAGQH